MDKLWPVDTQIDEQGDLWIGGCSASSLAAAHGTPLYLFDEQTLRLAAQRYLTGLKHAYPGTAAVAYASKAYLSIGIAQLFADEGLDLDVASGGELYVALRAGFPPTRIHFHGNNKSAEELREALAAGIGRFVVDNFHELSTLDELAARQAKGRVPIWLRLAPGVQAHTHAHIQTGQNDTKFGFTLSNGDAERAVAQAMRSASLELVGVHAHIGSQIYEYEPLAAAAQKLLEFAAAMHAQHGFDLRELSPGGGWGVPMLDGDPDGAPEPYIGAVSKAVIESCRAANVPLPHLVLEPGRSLVARAGVALYQIGARKVIPGVRTYVSVDGGMADNIRPALYGAGYTAHLIPAGRAQDLRDEHETVTIAGKFCESGDVLIRDILLPHAEPGDLLAIPMAGAYTLAMASNYNLARRPAVVLVQDGQATLLQRRESYSDLVSRDLPATAGGKFWKYQALGNDYIVLDPADWPQPPSEEQVRRICDRHMGVGSDGILYGPLRAAPGEGHALRLFNPDGGEFEKSGNGLRIFARYLWDRGYVREAHFTILTPAGSVVAHVLDAVASRIAMDMGTLSFDSQVIPVAGPARQVVDEPVTINGAHLRITAVTIGNPHCVVFVEGITPAPAGGLSPALAHALGPHIEHAALFPRRTNVQFAQAMDPHNLRIEIWERGAAYTLASGTSSCAAAGAAIRTGRCISPVTVHMPGGTMYVEVAEDWSVRLTGTVAAACSGEVSADLLG